VEPDDAAVEELRLRAQANRVAAAEHEREADALAPSATEEARLQARAHQEAAAQHQRTADDLDQRITSLITRSGHRGRARRAPGPSNPRGSSD
jgi:hypothetical protein